LPAAHGKTLASTEAIYSTRQPVTVAYINADGTPDEASAIALDGTETSLAAGWYFVGKDISYDATLTLGGDVNLILADGCAMNVGESDARINGHGIAREDGGDQALTIYGQNAGTGALNIYTDNGNKGIVAKAVTINGGHVTIDANGNWATGIKAGDEDITINGGNVSVTATGTNTWGLYANRNLTINGGTVEASGTADGIRIDNGTIAINGGTVNAKLRHQRQLRQRHHHPRLEQAHRPHHRQQLQRHRPSSRRPGPHRRQRQHLHRHPHRQCAQRFCR